jgi:uncharacterized damage-inducible protein DinB
MFTCRRLSILVAFTIATIIAISGAARAEVSAEQQAFFADYVADLERVGGRLAQLAEAVPADKFGWAPTDEVRTISEVYVHATFVNYFLPAALGAAPAEGYDVPEGTNPMELMHKWETDMTDKAAVIAKLKESFAYAAAAVPTITDLDTIVETFGFPGTKRAYLLILLTHAHEHLGQSIAYARSIGVVPPWSRPAAGGEGDGGGN